MRSPLKRVMLCAIACALAGCSNEINPRERWGATFSQYGVRALYPLRENVYLGDVYLFVESPCGSGDVTRASQFMLIGSFGEQSIKSAFERFYGSRPNYPRNARPAAGGSGTEKKTTTTDSKISVQASGVTTVSATTSPTGSSSSTSTAATGASKDNAEYSPDADVKEPIFTLSKPRFNRLPMAALPDLTLYDYIGGTGGGAFGWIAAQFAGERSEKVIVKARQVEMTELPATTFLQLVDEYKSSGEWQSITQKMPRLISLLLEDVKSSSGCAAPVNQTNAVARIMFVNGVLYTRNLSFEFAQDSAFAGKVSATLPVTTASALPGAPYSPPTLATAEASNNPAQAHAQALMANLATASGGPGGGFTLGIGSSGNLALIQSFAKPMAFATRQSLFEYPPGRGQPAPDQTPQDSGAINPPIQGPAASPMPNAPKPESPKPPKTTTSTPAAVDVAPVNPGIFNPSGVKPLGR